MFYILTLKKETVERCLAVSVVQSKYYHLTETGCWPPPAGRRQNVKSVDVQGRRRGLGKGWVWWLMEQIKEQLETSHGLDLLLFINRNGTFPLQVCLQIFSEINNSYHVINIQYLMILSSLTDVQLPKMINTTSWPWTSPTQPDPIRHLPAWVSARQGGRQQCH